MAVTWPALSPSVLPAADTSLAPSFWPRPWALFIFTKKVGLGLGDEADDGLGRLRLGQATGQGAGEGKAESAKGGGALHGVVSGCWDGRFLSAPCCAAGR